MYGSQIKLRLYRRTVPTVGLEICSHSGKAAHPKKNQGQIQQEVFEKSVRAQLNEQSLD
jgi:hypothetical protein